MTYLEPNNITTMSGLIRHASYLTGEKLGISILGIIFIISFIGLKMYSAERAFATSLFITTTLGILLRFMGLINDTWMFISIIGAGLSLVWLLKKD